jgi:hypothetical protein
MRGSAARSLVPALAVLALVGVVAIAATGSTPAGTSAGRKPSDTLLDTFFSLSLLLLLPGAALLVYGLLQRREIAREIASGRYPRTSIAAYLVFVAIFAVVVYFRYRGFDFRRDVNPEVVDIGADDRRARAPDAGAADPAAYRAEFAWIPVLVVVSLAAVAVLAFVLAGRRRRSARTGDETSLAEDLAGALEDTLDDLRAEPDPRRAVVAAFARLERTLGAVGIPRARAETADEYVARVLERLDVPEEAVGQLITLFDRAKFSQHAIDEGMKKDAIEALERVRDELRLAARRSAAEHDVETETPSGQAVTS